MSVFRRSLRLVFTKCDRYNALQSRNKLIIYFQRSMCNIYCRYLQTLNTDVSGRSDINGFYFLHIQIEQTPNDQNFDFQKFDEDMQNFDFHKPIPELDDEKIETHVPGGDQNFIGNSVSFSHSSTNNNGEVEEVGSMDIVENNNGEVRHQHIPYRRTRTQRYT